MSKTVKTTLVVATVLIVVGVVITSVAFGIVGFDIRRFSNVEAPTKHVYTSKPNADYQTLTVRGVSENYRIVQYSGTGIEVAYYEDAQTSFTIEEQGNTLVITEKVTPGFFIFNFDFSLINREIVISIPASFTGSIDFNSSSGNVSIQGLTNCNALKVKTSSGNIHCNNVAVNKDLSLASRSGDISCTRVAADGITLTATSGNIICNEAGTKKDLWIEALSGNITCTYIQAQTVSLKATSGNIRAQRLSISNLSCHANSGDIDVDVYAAENSFRITARSLSGNVRTPSGNTQATNNIDLSTTSGNIRLSFSG